jgi:molybdate transport system permease protein
VSRRPRSAIDVAVAVLAALGSLLFLLPLAALVWRAPWGQFAEQLRDPSVRTALRLSLQCSLSALVLSVVFGTPIALVLARTSFPGKRVVRSVLILPMVLPPVVGGVALLLAFGRLGLVGRHLFDWFGLRLAFTTTGVVLAETFVAMPFFIVTLEAALTSLDRRLEVAAATLGASRLRVFWTVTVPLVRPSLVAGAALSWARALGEFGATVTFAANVQGITQTAPLKVYLALDTDPDAAIVLSVLLLAVSVIVLAGFRDRWWGASR